MKADLILKNYEIAKERYAALGVDTDKAIETLEKTPISLHCWQADDVVGFSVARLLLVVSRVQVTILARLATSTNSVRISRR